MWPLWFPLQKLVNISSSLFALYWCHFCFLSLFRAHACVARSDSCRDPAPAAGPSVGAAGLQPNPLSHLLLVPVLPLLHANRGQRREQRHCQRVPVRGSQHLSLHPERPATLPLGPRPAGTGQPRRQEGEQRGYLPDWGRQWVGRFIFYFIFIYYGEQDVMLCMHWSSLESSFLSSGFRTSCFF